jgi:hypothetical protein
MAVAKQDKKTLFIFEIKKNIKIYSCKSML